jgi:beta-lactamase class A
MRLFLFAFPLLAAAGQLDRVAVERELESIGRGLDGRLGACVVDARGAACSRGAERFSMQSVMKLLVGIATLDAVDEGRWTVDTAVVVRREDLSLFVQPIAKLVTAAGYRTTVGDLVRRAIIDSDSAAADIQIARLGGTGAVQAVLRKKGVTGIRIDRDERHLQTEVVGIEWRPEFVDADALDRAIKAVPESRRSAAYAAYRRDERDTSTPLAMASMLRDLASGKMLSAGLTAFVMRAMADTVTFPDRLKAGLAPGWKLGHKTGSSGSWKGLAAATNDVGVMTAPDGTHLGVAVFIGDSKAPAEARSAAMAAVAAAAIRHYR